MLRRTSQGTSMLAINLLTLGTGRPPARASPYTLLEQISSSVPAHVRDTPQQEFDCHWRKLAMEWAPQLQPRLNTTQQRMLYDALELATLCGKPFAPTSTADAPFGAPLAP